MLLEVGAERVRQTAKWGEQNFPDGLRYASFFVIDPETAKSIVNAAMSENHCTFAMILLEEIAEAFAEKEDPVKLREELIQCAAVIVQWIEVMDRRRGEKGEG